MSLRYDVVDVFTDPLHPYSHALSDAFPRVGDPAARYAPAGLQGDPPDPRDLPPGCPFAPRCPRAVEACDDAEPPLVEVAPGRSVACIRVVPEEPSNEASRRVGEA